MGLTLAPEMARMVTTHLLRHYQPPPGCILRLYFDDLAATFPLLDTFNPLSPIYHLKETPTNLKQDAEYIPHRLELIPRLQEHRQPAQIDFASYHYSPHSSICIHVECASRGADSQPPSRCIRPSHIRLLRRAR